MNYHNSGSKKEDAGSKKEAPVVGKDTEEEEKDAVVVIEVPTTAEATSSSSNHRASCRRFPRERRARWALVVWLWSFFATMGSVMVWMPGFLVSFAGTLGLLAKPPHRSPNHRLWAWCIAGTCTVYFLVAGLLPSVYKTKEDYCQEIPWVAAWTLVCGSLWADALWAMRYTKRRHHPTTHRTRPLERRFCLYGTVTVLLGVPVYLTRFWWISWSISVALMAIFQVFWCLRAKWDATQPLLYVFVVLARIGSLPFLGVGYGLFVAWISPCGCRIVSVDYHARSYDTCGDGFEEVFLSLLGAGVCWALCALGILQALENDAVGSSNHDGNNDDDEESLADTEPSLGATDLEVGTLEAGQPIAHPTKRESSSGETAHELVTAAEFLLEEERERQRSAAAKARAACSKDANTLVSSKDDVASSAKESDARAAEFLLEEERHRRLAAKSKMIKTLLEKERERSVAARANVPPAKDTVRTKPRDGEDASTTTVPTEAQTTEECALTHREDSFPHVVVPGNWVRSYRELYKGVFFQEDSDPDDSFDKISEITEDDLDDVVAGDALSSTEFQDSGVILTREAERIAWVYKKMLNLGEPWCVVKQAMEKNGVSQNIQDVVMGRSVSAMIQKYSLTMLDSESEAIVAIYGGMLLSGVEKKAFVLKAMAAANLHLPVQVAVGELAKAAGFYRDLLAEGMERETVIQRMTAYGLTKHLQAVILGELGNPESSLYDASWEGLVRKQQILAIWWRLKDHKDGWILRETSGVDALSAEYRTTLAILARVMAGEYVGEYGTAEEFRSDMIRCLDHIVASYDHCLAVRYMAQRLGDQLEDDWYRYVLLKRRPPRKPRLIDPKDCPYCSRAFLSRMILEEQHWLVRWTVKKVVEKNPELFFEEYKGKLPLHEAATGSPLATIKAIFNANQDAIQRCDASGKLPLQIACIHGNTDAIDYFLIHRQFNRDMLSRLIFESKFDPSEETDLINCEILERLAQISPQIFSEKQQAPSSSLPIGNLPLHEAASLSPYLIVHTIYNAYPAAVYELDPKGRLPLHIACAGSNVQVAKMLYDAYPQAIMLSDANGQLPLDVALSLGNEAMVAFLMDQTPAEVPHPTGVAASPMERSMSFGSLDIDSYEYDSYDDDSDSLRSWHSDAENNEGTG